MPRLQTIAGIVAGRSISLYEAESNGGVHRGVMRLPGRMMAAPDPQANEELYLLRVVIDATRSRLSRTQPATVEPSDPFLSTMALLREVSAAMAWLDAEFDGFAARRRVAAEWILASRPSQLSPRAQIVEAARLRVLAGEQPGPSEALLAEWKRSDGSGPDSPPIPLWGDWLPPDVIESIDVAAEHSSEPALANVTTEGLAAPRDYVERVELPVEDDADVMPFHTFEKVECVDDYGGGARRLDGSDELEEHQDGLDELDLRYVVRGGPPAESVLRAELAGLSTIPDVGSVAPSDKGILYDEWHAGSGCYRPNWVTVYPSVAPIAADDAWSDTRLHELARVRRELLHLLRGLRQARRWVGRQPDGDEIDLEAWVEAEGERRAEWTGATKAYRRNPRRAREVATLVLMDQSLSSDSWVQDRRVLDVSRDAILVLGEVAHVLRDRLAVFTFASNTRNHCRVWQVKGFWEPWSIGKRRLAALRPTGYTRIGPALRHATALFDRVHAEQKQVLIITDGRPNDFDRYEGTYGVADVRQATREARRRGVLVHAFGVDPAAAQSMATMFGTADSQILERLEQLPQMLVEAYARIT